MELKPEEASSELSSKSFLGRVVGFIDSPTPLRWLSRGIIGVATGSMVAGDAFAIAKAVQGETTAAYRAVETVSVHSPFWVALGAIGLATANKWQQVQQNKSNES